MFPQTTVTIPKLTSRFVYSRFHLYQPDVILSLFHRIAYDLSARRMRRSIDQRLESLQFELIRLLPHRDLTNLPTFLRTFPQCGCNERKDKGWNKRMEGVKAIIPTQPGRRNTRGARLFALYTMAPEFSKLFSPPSLSPSLPHDFDRIGRVNDTRITLNAPVPSFHAAFIRPR